MSIVNINKINQRKAKKKTKYQMFLSWERVVCGWRRIRIYVNSCKRVWGSDERNWFSPNALPCCWPIERTDFGKVQKLRRSFAGGYCCRKDMRGDINIVYVQVCIICCLLCYICTWCTVYTVYELQLFNWLFEVNRSHAQ